jgi:hypothetical protein
MARPRPYLQPLSDRELRRRAQADVAATLGPLARMLGRNASNEQRNIQGVYGRLATDQGGLQQRQADIYGRARTSLEGYGAQGQQQLGQAGAAIGGGLDQALALSGNAPSQFGQETSRVQAGAAGRSGAALGELTLRQAAAENFAAQLPSITRLAGAQGVAEVGARKQRDLADLTDKGRSSLLDAILSGRKENFDKSIAQLGFETDIYGENADLQRQRTQIRAEERQRAQDRQADIAKENREAARERGAENREARREFAKEMREARRDRNKESRSNKEFRAREKLKARLKGKGKAGSGSSGVEPKD